jgi:hypothetical protein
MDAKNGGLHESIETNPTAFEQLDQLHDIYSYRMLNSLHMATAYTAAETCTFK